MHCSRRTFSRETEGAGSKIATIMPMIAKTTKYSIKVLFARLIKRAMANINGAINNPHAPNVANDVAVTKKTKKIVERRYCMAFSAINPGFTSLKYERRMKNYILPYWRT
jgi:hypothetical protein